MGLMYADNSVGSGLRDGASDYVGVSSSVCVEVEDEVQQ